jgi:hypothetical protein
MDICRLQNAVLHTRMTGGFTQVVGEEPCCNEKSDHIVSPGNADVKRSSVCTTDKDPDTDTLQIRPSRANGPCETEG